MLSDAVSFTTDGEDLARPYLIGSALLLGSFFIGVTAIPLYGYYLRVIDAGRTRQRGPPPFDDWQSLVVDGIKMMLVNLAYAGIPGLVFFSSGLLVLFGVGLGALGESGAFVLVVLVVGGLVTALAGLLFVVGTVTAPAALANMRAEGEFEAAFRVRTVLGLVATRDYLVAVLLAMVVGSVVSMVGGFLSFLLVGLPVLFFGGLVTFHLYGQGYRRAREAKFGPDDGPGGDRVGQTARD